jgi:hypothetical protein
MTSSAEQRLAHRLLGGARTLSRPEKEDILDAVLAEVAPERSRSARHAWLGVALACTAAGVLTVVLAPKPMRQLAAEGFVARGGPDVEPQLSVLCAEDFGPGRCRSGSQFMFEVAGAQRWTHLALYAERSDDVVLWYVPAEPDGRSIALDDTAPLALLPEQVHLGDDHPPGRYEVVGVFSNRALDRGEVEDVVFGRASFPAQVVLREVVVQ